MPRQGANDAWAAHGAHARGGSLLHHVPNRPPWFPRSTPAPGSSARPSGFSIRSQLDSFGFNPRLVKGSRSYLRRHGVQFRRAMPLSHNQRKRARAICNFRCATGPTPRSPSSSAPKQASPPPPGGRGDRWRCGLRRSAAWTRTRAPSRRCAVRRSGGSTTPTAHGRQRRRSSCRRSRPLARPPRRTSTCKGAAVSRTRARA